MINGLLCMVCSYKQCNFEQAFIVEDWFCLQLTQSFSCGPRKTIKRMKSLCPWQLHPFPKYVCGSAESTDFLLCLALYSCKWVYLNLQRKNSPSLTWFDSSNFYRNSLLIIFIVIFPNSMVSLDKPRRIIALYLHDIFNISIHSLVRVQ